MTFWLSRHSELAGNTIDGLASDHFYLRLGRFIMVLGWLKKPQPKSSNSNPMPDDYFTTADSYFPRRFIDHRFPGIYLHEDGTFEWPVDAQPSLETIGAFLKWREGQNFPTRD